MRSLRPASRWILVLAVVIGVAIPVLLTGGRAPQVAWWRAAMLPIALGCVMAGLLEGIALGRDEWRRRRPTAGRYALTLTLFAAGFLLVVGATN